MSDKKKKGATRLKGFDSGGHVEPAIGPVHQAQNRRPQKVVAENIKQHKVVQYYQGFPEGKLGVAADDEFSDDEDEMSTAFKLREIDRQKLNFLPLGFGQIW